MIPRLCMGFIINISKNKFSNYKRMNTTLLVPVAILNLAAPWLVGPFLHKLLPPDEALSTCKALGFSENELRFT